MAICDGGDAVKYYCNSNACTFPISIQPHKPHKINFKNSLINLYKLYIYFVKPHMYFVKFFASLYHNMILQCFSIKNPNYEFGH